MLKAMLEKFNKRITAIEGTKELLFDHVEEITLKLREENKLAIKSIQEEFALKERALLVQIEQMKSMFDIDFTEQDETDVKTILINIKKNEPTVFADRIQMTKKMEKLENVENWYKIYKTMR